MKFKEGMSMRRHSGSQATDVHARDGATKSLSF
jgi:hypothetical protein